MSNTTTSTPRVFTVNRSDIDRCPDRRLDPAHYRGDGTCLHTRNSASRMFAMNWQNDYDLYQAVKAVAREVLRQVPDCSDDLLGASVLEWVRQRAAAGCKCKCHTPEGIKNRAHACQAGGWDMDSLWGRMCRDVGRWNEVDPHTVAEDVREALGLDEQ